MEPAVSVDEAWDAAMASLTSAGVLPPGQRAIVRLTRPMGLLDDTLLLAAPDDWTKDQLEGKLRAALTDALSTALGKDVQLAVRVDPGLAQADDAPTEQLAEPVAEESPAPRPITEIFRPGTGGPGTRDTSNRLNDKYTFDTFVMGGSNRFAHAAAIAVAEAPAQSYSPRCRWGNSGRCRAHLPHDSSR